jgi:hypothetical protein
MLLLLGCGDVQFHLSPFTPKNVELVWSAQEHVTVVRWRVDAPPPVDETYFELWGPEGYTPISFADSVFPGGITACGDGGACAQYVTRERLDPPEDAPVVRAVHSRYGTLPGADSARRWMSVTLSDMKSFFNDRNEAVYVNIKDDVGAAGPYNFPRRFERAMWGTKGTCVSDSPPEGVTFSTLDLTGGFAPETPLTDAGVYCVAIRPIPADGGDRVMLEVRIATRPEVVTAEVRYAPPIETSPITYQIVLDLQIYSADRCAESQTGIEATVRQYLPPLGAPVTVRQLPTIDISPGCNQDLFRRVPAEAMAQEIKRAVTEFPQVHQQFHLLYFNNLDALLPGTLTESFRTLFEALKGPPPGHDLTIYPWIFNPGTAAVSDLGWNHSAWLSIDDPDLALDLSNYAARLPYRSQQHDRTQPVPLLSAEDATAHAGQLMKVCFASPYIIPVTTIPDVQPITGVSWQISADDPPAYLVDIPDQIAEPNGYFIENGSRVEYQICTRYCVDHPYVDTAGYGASSWAYEFPCEKDK